VCEGEVAVDKGEPSPKFQLYVMLVHEAQFVVLLKLAVFPANELVKPAFTKQLLVEGIIIESQCVHGIATPGLPSDEIYRIMQA
jgi:hypothetical protein